MNEKYVTALKDFTKYAQPNKYFIVGSVALLSYTQSHGYDREIHDIDIIMETSEALKTAERLKEIGYTQNTFINPRMPFYSKLMKFAENKYLRFSKDGVDIEILATSIEERGDLVVFEMYPGIKAGLPKKVFTKSSYSNTEFRTVSKEMLYFFKKFANNTVGKKVKYKEQQRYTDIINLQNLIDKKLFNEVTELSRIYILFISMRVPKLILR